MKRARFRCGAALAAGIAFALAPAAHGADRPVAPIPVSGPVSTPVSGLDEARALVRSGRFEEALRLLRPLARGRTVDASVLFNIGLAAAGASQRPGLSEAARTALLAEAIAALRRMLFDRPGLVRVRLELARAFFLKREDRLAQRHFEHVLAGSPPAAIAANIRRFLAEIRARRRWSFHIGAALAPDSNIGAESGERTIYIFGLPFRRDQRRLTSSGVGLSLWAGGEYQHPLGVRLRLRTGADILRHEHAGGRYDRMTLSAYAGPRWLLDADTEVSLLPEVRLHWLGHAVDHRDPGLRMEAVRRLGHRVTAHAQASWHFRRYPERTSLNGPVTDVSLGAAWAATPTVRLDGAVGWARERPRTERQRLTRRRTRAGISVALPLGFTAGAAGTLLWTEYQTGWFPYTTDGSPRRDHTWSVCGFLSI
ncbi:MAG: surface lipoprotein assembly modifier [Alphaproteobacteria bacterium]|nr:surface lipoprotein assembly modifier [Alphaproteobacteria bacterium]